MKPISTVLIAWTIVLLAAASATSNEGRFGVHVRSEPLTRNDPRADQFLPGHVLKTPAGEVRTVPSTHRLELTPSGGHEPILLRTEIPLRSPTGIAASNRFLWVADTGNRRIVRWNIEGDTVDPSSAAVLETPPLRRPIGLASDGANLFVADSWADQILVLDENGQSKRVIGQHGAQPGFLSGPIGLLLHDGLLFVADSRNSRVQAFNPASGAFAYEWGLHVIRPHEGDGRLHYPTQLLLDSASDTIGVTEPWEDRVQWFRRAEAGEQIEERLPLGADNFVHFGSGVAAYDRLVAITDPDTHTVRVFDLSLDTPVLIGVVGEFGSLPAQFIHPADVAFLPASDGRPLHLAVADRGNARVSLYSLDWSPHEALRFRPKLASLVRTFNLLAVDEEGRHPADTVAIAELPNGTLALLDSTNERVLFLDSRLRVVDQSRLQGGEIADPSLWTSLTVTPLGDIVALDRANRRVLTIKHPDVEITHLDPSIEDPYDLIVRENGFFVVDRHRHTLVRCNPDGTTREYIGGPGLGAGEFFKPEALLELPDGRILVVDRGNHRIQYFDPDWTLSMVDGPRLYISEAKGGGTAVVSPTPPAQSDLTPE